MRVCQCWGFNPQPLTLPGHWIFSYNNTPPSVLFIICVLSLCVYLTYGTDFNLRMFEWFKKNNKCCQSPSRQNPRASNESTLSLLFRSLLPNFNLQVSELASPLTSSLKSRRHVSVPKTVHVLINLHWRWSSGALQVHVYRIRFEIKLPTAT